MKNVLIITILCLAVAPLLAQKDKPTKAEKKPKLSVLINEGENPDVYIDGKKYHASIVDLLDFDKISSVDVVKGDQALEKYNAANGVIVITSKKAYEEVLVDPDAVKGSKVEVRTKTDSSLEPMIIIDDVVVVRDSIEKLSSDQIESIEVIKGEEAMEKHNAPYGVIKVKTKRKSIKRK